MADFWSGVVEGAENQLGTLIVAAGSLAVLWPLRRLRRWASPPPLRVYLSSTLCDLGHHRAAALAAIREAGGVPLGDPPDALLPELDLAHRQASIAAADLFVGLYAWRCGPPCPGGDGPVVDVELDLAEDAAGVTRQLWCLPDDAQWPPAQLDQGFNDPDSPVRRLRARVAPTARPLPVRPGALAAEIRSLVDLELRRRHPRAQLRARLLSVRTVALAGTLAVVAAGYTAASQPPHRADRLLVTLGVATLTGVVTYVARFTATLLITGS